MATSTPKTMRALVQPSRDSTELRLTTLPVPTAQPNTTEHLVRVHCVSPCTGELLWPKYFPPPNLRDTWIPCYDVAGTVVTSPPNSPFLPGDEVYCRANYHRQGCASEYTISVTEELAHRPQALSPVQSVAIPLSAQTAWEALFVHSGIGGFDSAAWKGKRIFVTAASGAVGTWATQLGKLVGATVIATCGPDNIPLVQSLGADEVLNYRSRNLKDWALSNPSNKVDFFLDCIGKKSLEEAWWTMKDGGVLTSVVQPQTNVKPAGCEAKDVKEVFFIMQPCRERLEAITKLVNEGKCRSVVDSVWPLEQYGAVFERLGSGHARGKIVMDLGLNC